MIVLPAPGPSASRKRRRACGSMCDLVRKPRTPLIDTANNGSCANEGLMRSAASENSIKFVPTQSYVASSGDDPRWPRPVPRGGDVAEREIPQLAMRSQMSSNPQEGLTRAGVRLLRRAVTIAVGGLPRLRTWHLRTSAVRRACHQESARSRGHRAYPTQALRSATTVTSSIQLVLAQPDAVPGGPDQ